MTEPTLRASRLVRLEEITPAYEYAAYFNVSIAPLVAHLGLEIFDGYDDLDELQFTFLTLPSGETVTLTEYVGTIATSLCVDLQKQKNIPRLIFKICKYLRLSRSEIEWIHEDWLAEVERLYAEHGEIKSIARPEIEAIPPRKEREAIDCFYYALDIYTRNKIPEYWAMLQHNLGLAYYHRLQGERWRNLQESIACFNLALEVFAPNQFLRKWQITQEDLRQSQKASNVEKQNLIRDILKRPRKSRDLSDADLSDANLTSADLSGAYLSYTDLSGAYLSYANLIDIDLRYANLRHAYLNDAYLRYADLRHANLSYANLRHANLSYANLNSTNLSYADLSNANLSYAYLNSADLSDTNLSGANLENARFGYNKGISESMRKDLKSRGAIFEDFPGDRSASLTPAGR